MDANTKEVLGLAISAVILTVQLIVQMYVHERIKLNGRRINQNTDKLNQNTDITISAKNVGILAHQCLDETKTMVAQCQQQLIAIETLLTKQD